MNMKIVFRCVSYWSIYKFIVAFSSLSTFWSVFWFVILLFAEIIRARYDNTGLVGILKKTGITFTLVIGLGCSIAAGMIINIEPDAAKTLIWTALTCFILTTLLYGSYVKQIGDMEEIQIQNISRYSIPEELRALLVQVEEI